MNTKWTWIPKMILAVMLFFLALSLWTLFLPHHGYGLLSFGVMYPAWLITTALAVLFATLQER